MNEFFSALTWPQTIDLCFAILVAFVIVDPHTNKGQRQSCLFVISCAIGAYYSPTFAVVMLWGIAAFAVFSMLLVASHFAVTRAKKGD